jgi:hypothetical protein
MADKSLYRIIQNGGLKARSSGNSVTRWDICAVPTAILGFSTTLVRFSTLPTMTDKSSYLFIQNGGLNTDFRPPFRKIELMDLSLVIGEVLFWTSLVRRPPSAIGTAHISHFVTELLLFPESIDRGTVVSVGLSIHKVVIVVTACNIRSDIHLDNQSTVMAGNRCALN